MNYQEIQDLIKLVSRSSVNEVEIEQKDFKISIKTESKKKTKEGEQVQTIQVPMQSIPQMPAQPMAAAAPAPAAAPAQTPAAGGGKAKDDAVEEDDSKYVTIKSPMIGTFYRRPSPDKDLFVNVGDTIKPGDVVCIIEAMKLFNEIEAEISGKVVKILADDSSPVEYDQPLFLIDPA
ncbi:MAG: acetyl-CoA carboxylase biotin carboxyl carrier protein [Luteibaculum sp.]